MGILFALVGLLAFVGGVGTFVVWVYCLVDALRREDLKESKWLWLVLMLVIAPVGMLAYAFVENRKKLAWYTIGFWGVSFLAFVVFLLAVVPTSVLYS